MRLRRGLRHPTPFLTAAARLEPRRRSDQRAARVTVAGAICVMMLAVIRFPQPWAYNQTPPEVHPKVRPRYQVHICVPCYNEPSDIVFATCEAALALRHPWAKCTIYMLDDGRNLEREKKCMLMGNERLIYIARNKYPGLPIHGKAGNINNVLKFFIFAKKAGAAPSAHPHRAHRARCPRRSRLDALADPLTRRRGAAHRCRATTTS